LISIPPKCAVAQVVGDLVEQRVEGLFHFASAGYASRYEVAAFILDRLALKRELQPCRTSEYPARAARPLNSRFDCRTITPLLREPIAPWPSSLERFLREP